MHLPFRSLFLVGLVSLFTTFAFPQNLPSNVNYSTLFGGSGEDRIAAVTIDGNGNIWVAGSTRSSDLPGTAAAQERHVPNYDSDGFVAKFSPDGELLFAHYLGGSGDDKAAGIAIDPNGNAFVVGTTSSSEFPMYESDAPLSRAFVAYVSADGKVIRPQRLPAGAANAIVAHRDGEFWVAGETENTAHAWVAKIKNPGEGYIEVSSSQNFGSTTDRALAIAVDASGNCYVTGDTSSPDFPTTPGAPQTTLAGNKDAFLIRLSPDGTLLFSTYFGNSGSETSGRAIALDADGNAYVAGTSNAGYGANAFVEKYSGDALVSSRPVGGSGTEEGNGIALDNSGFPVLVGKTDSPDFIAPFNCPYAPCSDAFMLTLDTPGISARIGGQEISEADSIVKDAHGNLFVSGMTRSPFWPVTDNALQRPAQGDNGFLMRFAIESIAPTTHCDDPAIGTWSKIDVEVACSASDSGSGLANVADSNFTLKTSIAPDTQTSAAETNSRKICDYSGNCATAGPYTGLWIDKKAPTIVINLNASYALHEVAIADYSCDDQNGSGVKSCVGPVGAGSSLDTGTTGPKTFTVAAIDNVGNEDSKSFTYEVVADTTAPVIRCGTPDQIWHRDNVTIACTSEDPGSGLANSVDANFLLTAAAVAGLETQNAQTDSRSVCDKAGNCATAGPISGIHLDTKAPVLARTGLLGLATTWSATDVTEQYTASDDGSGLANMADAIFSITTNVPIGSEIAGAATNSHTVCDKVANCATAGPDTYNIDKKAPSITIVVPNSQKYFLNQVVIPDFSCVDGGSGIATCYSPTGNIVPTGTVGQANFVVKASDKVAHVSSQTSTYEVVYKLRFGYDPEKGIKGVSYPIKLQLTDVNGVNRSAASVILTVVGVSNINTGATLPAGGTFRYDRKLFDSGGYILNLDTSGLAQGSYALLFQAGANANTYSAAFSIR